MKCKKIYIIEDRDKKLIYIEELLILFYTIINILLNESFYMGHTTNANRALRNSRAYNDLLV